MRELTRPLHERLKHHGSRGSNPSEFPTRIGRYALQGVLGHGAMGVVHRALDTVLGRTVAIKTIREELVLQEHIYTSYRRRFYNEASICGSLSHPNIVTLFDVGETEEGVPFLAMEYVPGASLAATRERFSLDQIMWFLAQLASAMDYAHGQDVIHRDIKPSNILIGEGQEVKITDFGVAKMLGSDFTRSQTVFGTPGYMSPEQVLGTPLTCSTDLFSLAVVAFELLSGETPFPGKDVHSILYKLVHADPVFPSGLAKMQLDTTKWREVFAVALAKDPQQRCSTASEFVSGLVELVPGWLDPAIPEDSSASASDVGPFPSGSDESRQETLTLWRSCSKG